MALTAGNKTRLLLSVVRDMTASLHFFTADTPNTRLDVHTAGRLAARHNLDHRLLPKIMATEAEQADWHARTGYTFGGPHIRTHPTTRQFADQPFFGGGFGGETGRGFFWRKGDTDQARLDAGDIWTRTGMPHDDSRRVWPAFRHCCNRIWPIWNCAWAAGDLPWPMPIIPRSTSIR